MIVALSQENRSTENLVCNLCDAPGTFADAEETARVRAVVREFADEEYTVWRCRHCKSLHCKEPIDHEVYYKNYPLKTHTLDFPTRRAYGNRLRFLKRLGFTRDSTLLDYGSGGGAFIAYLRERKYGRVTGFDPFCDEFSDESVLEQTYDFVTSYEVIEHSEEPAELFTNLCQLLSRPNGWLIVGTPRAEKIDLKDFRTFGVPLHQPHHRHILSFNSLMMLGTKNGLQFERLNDRFPFDTRWPLLNWACLKEYVYRNGSVIDALFEPPRFGQLLTAPRLMFLALFGYYLHSKENMIVAFKTS